ncbi:MAG: disulfide bond formation protein B [Rhodospirillales bacterium]
MRFPQPRLMGLLASVLAAGALGLAFASEWWGGLVPCTLCLWERWPYRIAIGLGLLVAIAPRSLLRPTILLLVLTILAASVLAAVHTGVEFHWWPSPFPACAAPKFAGATIAERLKSMPLMPAKPCDEPTYLIPFVPVSMAAMNFLFSLAFAGLVSLALRAKVQSR